MNDAIKEQQLERIGRFIFTINFLPYAQIKAYCDDQYVLSEMDFGICACDILRSDPTKTITLVKKLGFRWIENGSQEQPADDG